MRLAIRTRREKVLLAVLVLLLVLLAMNRLVWQPGRARLLEARQRYEAAKIELATSAKRIQQLDSLRTTADITADKLLDLRRRTGPGLVNDAALVDLAARIGGHGDIVSLEPKEVQQQDSYLVLPVKLEVRTADFASLLQLIAELRQMDNYLEIRELVLSYNPDGLLKAQLLANLYGIPGTAAVSGSGPQETVDTKAGNI